MFFYHWIFAVRIEICDQPHVSFVTLTRIWILWVIRLLSRLLQSPLFLYIQLRLKTAQNVFNFAQHFAKPNHKFIQFIFQNCITAPSKDCGPNEVLNPRFLHRCYYPQCTTSTTSCPDQRVIKFNLSPRPKCACSEAFAYTSENTCAPINSIECGQLGYSWTPLLYNN